MQRPFLYPVRGYYFNESQNRMMREQASLSDSIEAA
jgi:hypothetical protein